MPKLFSKDHQPDYSTRPVRGPNKKQAMLNAIEKKFPGGTQEFCEHLLEVGLSGGPEGSAVPVLLNECLKRVEPPLKQTGVTIELDIKEGATHAEKAEAIFAAVSAGAITIESGQMLIGMIKDTLSIVESTELVKRLEEIEQLINTK
jgi:hypothetical protein